MKILIVEDDLNKYNHVINFLKDSFDGSDITTKRSYQSGLREILNKCYDFILLDMGLPTFDISQPKEPGGPFRAFAGEEILYEMARDEVCGNVIILTQFEAFGDGESFITLSDLKRRLNKNFNKTYLGAVYYNTNETTWKNELYNLISNNLSRIQK